MLKHKLLITSLLLSTPTFADPATLEIATIIPDGTGAASDLNAFSKRVSEATKGEIRFKFQWGGLAGDDSTVLAAIKSGKLAGALLAGQILSEVAPGMRETEKLFQFGDDTKKAWAFVEKNQKTWNKQLTKNSLYPLGTYEAGFVYLVSRKPFANLNDIKGMNIWSWPKDTVSHKSISTLGGKAVDVPVQDTYKALADGRLDMAYAPPIAIVALQWSSKITHLLEQPVAFAVGTFVLAESTWKKIPAASQAIIAQESKTSLAALTVSAQKDNAEALSMLKSPPFKIVRLTDADIARAKGR